MFRTVSALSTFFLIYLATLGLCIGSFLNVVIARLPAGESIVRPRSKCLKCGRQLTWYENIPVFAWLALGGKCRGCGASISVRYVVVEVLTAGLFLWAQLRFGWTWPLVPALTFITVLIPLVFIDAEHWILPFELTLPGLALGVLLQIPLGVDAVQSSVVGAMVGFLVFRVLEFFGWLATKKEALGAGDKYLVATIGAFVGSGAILGILLLGSLQGAVFGIAKLKLHGRAGPDSIPGGETSASQADEDETDEPQTFSPAFLAAGLPFWKRLALVPFTLLFQDIPDPILDESTGADLWTPQANNLPFGPWLGLAGVEIMLLGPAFSLAASDSVYALPVKLFFGG
jgi:leader peptidase (prepilin peptidase)/N-methyltransferase